MQEIECVHDVAIGTNARELAAISLLDNPPSLPFLPPFLVSSFVPLLTSLFSILRRSELISVDRARSLIASLTLGLIPARLSGILITGFSARQHSCFFPSTRGKRFLLPIPLRSPSIGYRERAWKNNVREGGESLDIISCRRRIHRYICGEKSVLR